MDLGYDRARILAEEDRISSLPDELIHHILSFIDIKFSVRTSVLSSRWKLIWTSLPHLNFSSYWFRTLPKFSKFVTHVLSRHNNQTNLYSVQLSFRGAVSQVFVKRIANYAVSHNVQKLTIWCDPVRHRELPHCLFSSQSLKHLSLRAAWHRILNLPKSPWNLPALTTLHLSDILFCDDDTDKCLDFFSKCVNLKNLSLKKCYARGLEVFKIFAPQLAYLTILHCATINKFVISAPNLSSFDCQGCYPNHFSTDGFHSLDKVNLLVTCVRKESKEDAHQLINLLQDFCTTKFLTVSSDVIECLANFPDLLEIQHSPFSDLKYLKIKNAWPKSKSTYSTLPNHVRNYLVNSSASATVIMEFPEEQPKKLRKSRKQVQEEARAKMKAVLEAHIERLRAKSKANLEQTKAEAEAIILKASSSVANECQARLDTLLESQRAETEAWFTRLRAEFETQTTTVRSRKKSST